jgi:hypothetical protein
MSGLVKSDRKPTTIWNDGILISGLPYGLSAVPGSMGVARNYIIQSIMTVVRFTVHKLLKLSVTVRLLPRKL